jgi:V/A-type H+-transporting ATPase subunit F
MYKIAVIGSRESILGFKAMGLSVFPCHSPAEARKTLHKAAEEGYAIIYITEGFSRDMPEDIDRYRDVGIPAVIPIPGMHGSFGVGMNKLKRRVERAVGADILAGGRPEKGR